MLLDAKVKKTISKEHSQRVNLKNHNSREQITRVNEKYNNLKERGLIQDDSYGIATIGQNNNFNRSIYTVN
jgi:hypothetical protein